MAYNVIQCKKSPKTLKQSKLLICNLGSRAQKSPKSRVVESWFTHFLIFGTAYFEWFPMNPHMSRGWQRVQGVSKAELQLANVNPRFKKFLGPMSVSQKLPSANFRPIALKLLECGLKYFI